MKVRFNKILSLFLAILLCIGVMPLQAFAEGEMAVLLPETEIEEDILQSDVFYIASPSAQLAEEGGAAYLLRIGRGGEAQDAASVHIRIADVTAKYGEDYIVRVHETGTAAENPQENLSLMEMMEEQPFTQSEIGTDEELAAMLEADEEGQAVLNEGIQSAVDFLDEESGLREKYPEGYPTDEPDKVQQARAAFTGVQGTSQRLSTQSDMFQDLQSVADVLTTAVVGADITLNFAPGESMQYLELIPKNNREGDGNRLFYLVLNSPEGSTTVSSADSCAVTIVDDEEQAPAVVSFSAAEYSLVPGEQSVTVKVERSGAMNSTVSAVVRTTGEGTAVAGRDYSEVERSLLFPFGVSSLTVDIPVCTEYFIGEADFVLSLEAETGCTVGMGAATVTMTGASAPKASLMFASKPVLASSSTTTDRNNLATLKVLDPIDISKPAASGHQDNYYGGNNHYESGNQRWLLEWMDSTIFRDRKGTLGAVWQLSEDEGRYWIAGAQVVWERTGSCAEITVDIDGYADQQSFFTDWKSRGDDGSSYDLYRSTANFPYETVNMYPTESSIRDHYSFSPKWISFYNRGRCDDCNRLWIYSIKPILRPFQINLKPAQALEFLQENGSKVPDDGTATQARIVGSDDQIVCFLDDKFTVTQLSGSNVQQYAKMSKLTVVDDDGNAIYTLGKNSDTAFKDITYTLSKDALTDLKKGVGTTAFRKMIKENKFATGKTAGYANYCEVNVQPTFDYIDSAVTLQNPYDFPVTMVISGAEYTLAARESRELTYHLGDKLALTEIRLTGKADDNYTAVGAATQFKRSGAEADYESVNLNFIDQNAVYLGGSNTGDHRLCCREMIVKPNLQEKSNRIIVRVKTNELDLFDTGESTGLLHQKGKKNGQYTEFVLANADQTFNGKLYTVTAYAADGYTCLWNDQNTDRYYEGSTLYFTAGAEPARNVITLSAIPAAQSITLSGTLHYMNYNLRTLDAGSASAIPAMGAVVAAGSASAVADENGFFRTGALSISGASGHYLRYLVSVNGNALVQETLLPASGGDLDLSSNFSGGVSPVSSDIFSGLRITASYPASSGYTVADGTYLPIVSGVAVDMKVDLHQMDYTVTTTGEFGTREQTLTEHPKSVILAVYDSNGHFKGKYDAADCEYDDYFKVYSVSVPVDFAVDSETGGSFSVAPGDRLYLRLTTDRLAQAGDAGEDYGYTYSDIYTGFSFIAPTSYEAPVEQGLDSPVKITYENLPLIGTAGMNLNFPFVSVGWTKIDRGYRMYIGVSPVQIYDAIKGTHTSSFAGDDGVYWGNLFKLSDPFKSFADGMKSSYSHITKGIGQGGISSGSLGSPQWRFDLQLGAYFDFYNPTVVGLDTDEYDGFYFAGVGFYMSATLGFKVAWYFVIPVVFIPAYIGIELEGMVMGFLGAAASGKAIVSMDEARHKQVDFDDNLDEFSGSVRGVATAQLNLGVGLCGTLGVRAVGKVRLIGEYAPSDIVRDWGVYIGLNAGITVDLFLFSIPLVFELYNSPFGSFEDYVNGVSDDTKTVSAPARTGLQNSSDPFRLRAGSGEDSDWMGSKPLLQSSLTPVSSKVLVNNAYERSDAQLITLDNGTVVLAFIDSDNAKGPYQRTTLMLSTYCNGKWSKPVPVCEDDTADFQPSICETKDGKVLVSWISTGANDITDETATVEYLCSMDVFAAFATVGEDGSITVDTPTRLTTGTEEHFYDSNPTVVCDKVSGDAIVYYIKSGSTTENAAELANPYTNDCVVCYMYYNAETDSDGGNTVPAGWLKSNYYSGEYAGEIPNIEQWGGQRFLNSPTFKDANNNTHYYAIPDFTAIGYNGLAVFAYTVDKDSSNDTDSDKELYLQVFNFAQHELKYRIQLTDDDISDTLPQFFRAKDAGISTDEKKTHTKLFWYRDGKGVCYIDVTSLVQEGINPDGSFVAHAEDDTDEQGRLHSHYVQPHYVGSVSNSSAASQMANFRVAEDSSGSTYIVWTEGVTGEDGTVTQQIFAMGMYSTPDEYTDEQANNNAKTNSAGWSKPRQLTTGDLSCDEPAVTICEDGLMIVHNSYQQTLNIRDSQERFEGIVDYDPIEIDQIRLNATILKPCGAVETDDICLTYAENAADDKSGDVSVALPEGGKDVCLTVHVANNGLTAAEGYKLTLYADQNGTSTEIDSREISDELMPTSIENHSFVYTLPENVEGLSFRAVTQEKRSTGGYYADTFTNETEPLERRANYVIQDVETIQTAEGFQMSYTLTNNGNAAGEGDTLRLYLNGPFNLDMEFDETERLLYTGEVGALAVGKSRTYVVPVSVPAKMLEKYGFIDASAVIVHPTGDGAEKAVSERTAVQFALTRPMNMSVDNVQVAVNGAQTPRVSMELAQRFGGSGVSLAVADQTVATVRNGQIVGLNPGTTALYVTHTGSGAVMSADVTVTDQPVNDDSNPAVVPVSIDGSNVDASAVLSGSTATVNDIPAEEISKVGSEPVSLDFSNVGQPVDEVKIPTETVKTISQSASEGLAIKLSTGTAALDAAAVDAVSEAATGEYVSLCVETVDENALTAAQKEKIENLDDAVILQATLTSGGRKISDLGGGSVTITVPHEQKDADKDVVVYCLDDTGKLTQVNCVYDAKTKSVTFTGNRFSTYVIAEVDPIPFTDLTDDAYYMDAIRWAYRNGITEGTSATSFSPDAPVTRAQVVTFLWRAAGCPEPTGDADRFADVKAGSYYEKAVAWAIEQGITYGVSDTEFAPDSVCARCQIVTFLARFAGVKDADTESVFSDVKTTDYFAAAVKWAKDNQVTTGTSATTFSPNENSTRAQVVTFLYRWMVK